jgi:hypothetical protein
VRRTPRGERREHGVLVPDPENAWPTRWEKAGEAVGWDDAVKAPMIALKDSPIWIALGNGAGGYRDTLGNSFPPFAFGSGMAFSAVDRARCQSLGLLGDRQTSGPMFAELSPGEKEISDAIDRLPPELRARLERRALLAA